MSQIPPPPPLGYAMPTTQAYRSSSSLAKTVIIMLFIMLGLDVVGGILSALDWIRMGRAGSYDEYIETLDAVDFAMLGWGLIYFGMAIATAVVWCMWQYRVHNNLPAFGKPVGSPGAGWGVGSFFVPIANLFVPYRAMKHIFTESKPMDARYAQRSTIEDSVVGWWWAAWIVNNIMSNISTRVSLKSSDLDLLRTMAVLDVICAFVGIAAAILAVRVVREVQSRQLFLVESTDAPVYG